MQTMCFLQGIGTHPPKTGYKYPDYETGGVSPHREINSQRTRFAKPDHLSPAPCSGRWAYRSFNYTRHVVRETKEGAREVNQNGSNPLLKRVSRFRIPV